MPSPMNQVLADPSSCSQCTLKSPILTVLMGSCVTLEHPIGTSSQARSLVHLSPTGCLCWTHGGTPTNTQTGPFALAPALRFMVSITDTPICSSCRVTQIDFRLTGLPH